MTEAWTAQIVPLDFRLGEVTLFSVESRLHVRNAEFLGAAGEGEEPGEPGPALLADSQGVLIRSHPVAERLPRLARLGHTIRYVPSQYERYYVDLTWTKDRYFGKFSGKSRSTQRRKIRKFAKTTGGDLDWRVYRTPEELAEFHALARRISERTYQEKLLDAGLPDDEEFRDRMAALAGNDSVRAYLLFDQGQPVAYLYCPVRDGVLLYEYLGYDPRYTNLSPGTVLQWLALESLFEEGRFRLFDFTEGEGAHKEFFATGSRRCANIYFFRRSLRNFCLVWLHAGLECLTAGTARVLDRLGLKSRIKRFLRSR